MRQVIRGFNIGFCLESSRVREINLTSPPGGSSPGMKEPLFQTRVLEIQHSSCRERFCNLLVTQASPASIGLDHNNGLDAEFAAIFVFLRRTASAFCVNFTRRRDSHAMLLQRMRDVSRNTWSVREVQGTD